MKDKLLYKLNYCLEHLEKNCYCTFGGKTRCVECGTPYLLLKLINGKVLHGDMERLGLEEWKTKAEKLQNL